MKRNLMIAAIAMSATIAPAYAGQDEGQSAAGRVETVMVKEARGLYIEKKLVRKAEDKEVWVEVRFPGSGMNGAQTDLFQVPENATLERGDIVVAEVADQSPRVFSLIADVNRVTSLVARHDTLYALLFDMGTRRAASAPYALPVSAAALGSAAFNPVVLH